jgi:hypothetical protein
MWVLKLVTIEHPSDHLLQGQRLLKSFVYPDSRAEFIKLLALSGLLQETDIPFGTPLQTTDLDFYSYAQSFTASPSTTTPAP